MGVVIDPLIKLRILDEAMALMMEFGAGAALFAKGQVIAAQREGSRVVADYWSAVLGAVKYAPSGDDLEGAVSASPDRVPHRPWQDYAAVTRRSRVRDTVAVDPKRAPPKRRRAGIRH